MTYTVEQRKARHAERMRRRRAGLAPPPVFRRTTEDRFWAKVRETDGCWEWTASKYQGYGRFSLGRVEGKLQLLQAHRVAYEWLVGPIPAGLQLDHLCRNHSCVNPAHLEPVTARENKMRGLAVTQPTCAKGHPYRRIHRGRRVCDVCPLH